MEYNIPGMEKIWLKTVGGKIETWFLLPESNQPSPAVIFAHGNAEIIDMWPATLNRFTQLGIGVLLVEYPGYGRSKGSPSQRSITELPKLLLQPMICWLNARMSILQKSFFSDAQSAGALYAPWQHNGLRPCLSFSPHLSISGRLRQNILFQALLLGIHLTTFQWFARTKGRF